MASIQKRGDNSFLLVVEVGYKANGKRDKRTKTIRIEDKDLLKTKKRLRDYLEGELYKFKIEVEAGEYIAPEKMLFSSFVEEWRRKYGEKNMSISTLEVYDNHLKNHILPTLGFKRIDQIKTMQIVNFLDALDKPGSRRDGDDKEGLSAGTIQYIYKILRNIFKRATEWKLIKESPMVGVKQPKVERKEMEFFDSDEAEKLIEALYKEPVMWRLCFLTALIGGLRRGEIIALEWSDINFDKMTISITKNIPLTKNKVAVIRKPKANSIRTIVMPEWYMAELQLFQLQWDQEKEDSGDSWQGGDKKYIFHAGFGKPLFHNSPTQKWIEFRNKHKIKQIRLHDLRHTMVTFLIEAGVNPKAVQKRVGHSNSQITTDVYTHVTNKASQDAAEKFDKFDPRGKFVNNSSTS